MNETTPNVSVLPATSVHQPAAATPPRHQDAIPPSHGGAESRPRPTALGVLARAIPNALVLLLLGGLAYWGHHTGWSAPKFADVMGVGRAAQDDWCGEHAVPESLCVECNDALLPKAKQYGWCRTHGVHNCPFEHPDVAQLKYAPHVTPADVERARRALDLKERPENSPKCKMHHRRIQLASQDVLDKMGIDVAPVWEAPMVETIRASGEIVYEQPRVAPLHSPVPGRVWWVTDKGRVGVAVRQGDVLALVDAAEVGKAKGEFLQAFAQADFRARTVERLRAASGKGILPEAKFQEAQAALREAEIRLVSAQQALLNLGLPVQVEAVKSLSPEALGKHLQFLGVPEELAKALDPKTTTANLIAVRASRAGVVVSQQVVAGEMVGPGKVLFVVIDNSRLWLMLHVRAEDMRYVRVRDAKTGAPGQQVRFRPDGTGREVTGELVWKSTAVDEKTRTVQVRADLPNPDGLLRANSFGTGSVVLREEKKAVVVPTEAVHWEGDCNVVFVRDKHFLEPGAPKVFHVRTLRPGVRNEQYTEVIAGVLPGEVVATRNSASLRAELLKNRLGEG